MTRTKKKTQARRRKKPQARRSETRRAPSSNDLRVAALLSFEHFKRVFSHPSVDFERTVSFGFAADSALLMACHSDGRDTIAKARWLVDHGASVCKLLEYRCILGDWRVGVNGNTHVLPGQVVAALERLFRKHCAMVVRLIGLKTDVPLLPLALEQEVASFLV